ncbi:MAG: hypothetical protein R8P61_33690 [Bacteroidia bacterium]|nr:hypothetical protein [Bacteroidia bacterium]
MKHISLHHGPSFALFTYLLILSWLFTACKAEHKPHEKVQDNFYGQLYKEGDDNFWKFMEEASHYVSIEKYYHAQKALDKASGWAREPLHRKLINTLHQQIASELNGSDSNVIQTLQEQEEVLQYMNSNAPADMMLAYNYAAMYVRKQLNNLGSFQFPGALVKKDHIILYKGNYKIKSYVDVISQSGKKLRHNFNCEIKVHKDRKRYKVKSFELFLPS